MVTLPFPVADEGTREAALRWRAKLLHERRVEVPVIPIDGRLFVRISAQVYNELSDYEALARSFG
jgi:isopenicillin-N epimerase